MVAADRKAIFARVDEQARVQQAKVAESAKAAEKQVPAGVRTETQKPTAPVSEKVTDAVVYRVQILTSPKPKTRPQITAGGNNYRTFEYLYNGAYRICAGEFSTLAAAREFQSTLRSSGFSQAFVVAFKNNVRTLDPALFK